MALTPAEQQDPFEGLDRGLVEEITAWKRGSPPPHRLLQFPGGPPAFPVCGMSAFGAHVADYVSGISDDELLQALLFDPRANAECARAAARRLLELRGVHHVRAMLADRRRTSVADFAGTEPATLTQLLESPYARVRVASLERGDATKETAEQALAGLEADLVAGVTWERAYPAAATLLSDKERSQEEGGWRTFLCYRYDGLISPIGFDLLDRRISEQLPPHHIRKVFEGKGGVLRLETAGAYWLYYVEAFYE